MAGASAVAKSSSVIATDASIIRRLSEHLSTRPAFGTSFGFVFFTRRVCNGHHIRTSRSSKRSGKATQIPMQENTQSCVKRLESVIKAGEVLYSAPRDIFPLSLLAISVKLDEREL